MYSIKSLVVSFCVFSIIRTSSATCPADSYDFYSYDKQQPNGPENWGKTYRMCNGDKQSPVNIETKDVVKDDSLKKLQLINYDKPITKSKLENDGHTVNVYPQDGVERSFKINGGTYYLRAFHWRWGASEHTINNEHYTMELQLVHTNVKQEIVMISVLNEGALIDNGAMDPIVNALPQVTYRNTTTQITETIYLEKLIDVGCSYYRYDGSLTNPPCTQVVIWSVCKDSKRIQNSKVEKFKELYSTETNIEGCKITQNYRPIQKLNGRKIRSPAFHLFP